MESFQYDYSATFDRGLGLLTSRTDANGRTTAKSHDVLGRVKRIDFPDGGVERRYYSDLEPSATHHQTGALVFPEQARLPLRTKSYALITSSPFLERESFEVADGLARLSLSGLRNGSEMDWTQTLYDGNERVDYFGGHGGEQRQHSQQRPVTLDAGFEWELVEPQQYKQGENIHRNDRSVVDPKIPRIGRTEKAECKRSKPKNRELGREKNVGEKIAPNQLGADALDEQKTPYEGLESAADDDGCIEFHSSEDSF